MKNLFILLLLSIASVLNAQQFGCQWAAGFGSTDNDQAISMAIDAAENVYITGTVDGTTDFDPGPAVYTLAATSTDIFVAKYNSSGNFVWAKVIGGTAVDMGLSITCNASGSTFVTGTFKGSVDFNPGSGTFSLTATGPSDGFVLNLDPLGNFIWAKRIGGSGSTYGRAIKLDASGNIYVGGEFYGTVDLDPGASTSSITSAGSNDGFIVKLTSSGNFSWGKVLSGASTCDVRGLAIDQSGNVCVTGYYEGSIDLDPGPSSSIITAPDLNAFVLKLNSSGNFSWGSNLGGNSSSVTFGTAITTDLSGNVYTTGHFGGICDFDPGTGTSTLSSTSNFDHDVYISKLTASGNFAWAKRVGGNGADRPLTIMLENNTDLFVGGYFSTTVDFNPDAGSFSLTSNGSYDFFIMKLDASAGSLLRAESGGGTQDDAITSIVPTASDHIVCAGIYTGTVALNSGTLNLNPIGELDMFLTRFTQPPVGLKEHEKENELNVFPNPTSGMLYVDTKEAQLKNCTFELFNASGQLVMKNENVFQKEIDLALLPKGFYLIKIITENRVYSSKLVKN